MLCAHAVSQRKRPPGHHTPASSFQIFGKMGKRASNGGTDGAAAFRKRQKIAHEAPSSEDIESSDQLRRLLAFDQDLRRTRHGELLLCLISRADI